MFGWLCGWHCMCLHVYSKTDLRSRPDCAVGLGPFVLSPTSAMWFKSKRDSDLEDIRRISKPIGTPLCQGVRRPHLILACWLPKILPAIITLPSSGRLMSTEMLGSKWLILWWWDIILCLFILSRQIDGDVPRRPAAAAPPAPATGSGREAPKLGITTLQAQVTTSYIPWRVA
jgi:hypothetical protein